MPDLREERVAVTPTADPGTHVADFEDQIVFDTNSAQLYRALSTAAGDNVSALAGLSQGYQYGNVTPVGAVTPNNVGEIYIWDEYQDIGFGGEYYKIVFFLSTGLTVNDWTVVGGTPWYHKTGGALNPNGNYTPDYVGQWFFDYFVNYGSDIRHYIAVGPTDSDWEQFHSA